MTSNRSSSLTSSAPPASLPSPPSRRSPLVTPPQVSSNSPFISALSSPLLQRGKPLRRRLLWITLPAILLPLALASVLQHWQTQRLVANNRSQQLQNASLLASYQAETFLQDLVVISNTVAENSRVVEALRSAGDEVAAAKLDKVAVEQLEAQYQTTKLLRNSTLNQELRQTAEAAGLMELSITERHGLNVASNIAPADLVQRDETWWQASKTQPQVAIVSTEEQFSIEFSQAIRDPQSRSLLGVVKATVAATDLQQNSAAWQLIAASNAWNQALSIQWIDTRTGAVLPATPVPTLQHSTLDQSIQQVATTLVTGLDKSTDADRLKQALSDRFAFSDLQIAAFTTAATQGETPGFRATLTHQQQRYTLTTVPGSAWVAIVSAPLAPWYAASSTWLVAALLLFGAAALTTMLLSQFAAQLSTSLNYLSQTTRQVAAGNFAEAIPVGDIEEVQTLTQSLNTLGEQIKTAVQRQVNATQQMILLTEISSEQVTTQAEMQQLFETTLAQARHLLSADRLVVYRFIDAENTDVAYAATAKGWTALNPDPCEVLSVPQVCLQACKRNEVVAFANVDQANLSTDYQEWLSYLQVRAELLVPIFHNNDLYGLLAVHHCAAPHPWQADEIQFAQQLTLQWGKALDRIILMQNYRAEIERSQLLRDITLQLTQASTLDAIFTNLPLASIRQVLQVDRVMLYHFDDQGQGTVTLESALEGIPHALGAKNIYNLEMIQDDGKTKQSKTKQGKTKQGEAYKRGQVQVTVDIHQAGLTARQLQQLEQMAVRADLVAPILQGDDLLGLLIAHHCATPRSWQAVEVELLSQIATQVSFALDRCKLLEQREVAATQAQRLAEEQRQQKETLQQQLMVLIEQVEAAAQGNLTVRAVVADGAIGSVADFLNVLIESLQGIVTQVQQVALQVSSAIQSDDLAVRQLAQLALVQAEEVNVSIAAIQHTLSSVQSVANSAAQAVEFTQTASTTAQASGTAMDNMVQNILGLRDAIGTTAKKVKRLGESSQQISRAVSLIEKVALQTNVLAINAGIEASRAGEEGQGFAVVAEEIGQLAIQAATATQEISELVQLIQVGTNEVVEAMEQSTTQVVEGTHLVEEAKLNLAETLQVFNQINQRVQLIFSAAKSQSQTFHSMTDMMQKIAISSERTSRSSHTVSQSLQRTVEIAETLQTSVKTFRV